MADEQLNPSELTPTESITSDIEKVVSDVTPIVNNVSTVVNAVKVIISIVAVCGFLFSFLKGCSCLPKLNIPIQISDTKVTNQDLTKSVTQTDTSVTYTPKATKANPKPTPVTLYKPLEGKVIISDTSIAVQNSGFTFIPKISYVYVLGDGFQWAVGTRFVFVDNFGLETQINTKHIFLGVDARDPYLNILTTSLGMCNSYQNLLGLTPYIGEEVTLRIF